MHTACVSHQPWRARWLPASAHASERPDLWSEKTTVCRIFSCQRSSGGNITLGTYGGSGRFPRTPFAHSLAGPQSPAPFARGVCEITVYVLPGRRATYDAALTGLLLSPVMIAHRPKPEAITVDRRSTTIEQDVGDRGDFISLTPSPKLFKEPAVTSPPSRCRASARQPPLACRAVAPQGAEAGGEYRARTGDLLVANQALSQLS